MKPTRKQSLFLISGASCAGKTTVCEALFQREKDYIVLESDILWEDRYNTPEDNYRAYREKWMTMCANISQIGLPCVLCGCCMPEQFEPLCERQLFSNLYYLAVVVDDDTMMKRLTHGRGVTDESWIKSSMHFNKWLRENGEKHTPLITLLDTSRLTPEEGAAFVDKWIMEKLEAEQKV